MSHVSLGTIGSFYTLSLINLLKILNEIPSVQVHIGPDDWMSETALHSKKPWRAVLARRRWRSGYNAGGSPAYIG